MSRKMILVVAAAALSAGCASVPMESKEASDKAKLFAPPPAGMSGLYIYRAGGVGAALKKDVFIDGECVGESAQHVFFYQTVAGNQMHTIATESEFSPNVLELITEGNKNYFIEQYIKIGVFVGGANLRVMSEEDGKKDVAEQELATKGTCSGAAPSTAQSAAIQPPAVSPAATPGPVASAAVPMTPTPTATPGPAYVSGQVVQLSGPHSLRVQPKATSAVSVSLPAGTSVTLDAQINGFWYVKAIGVSGWLPAAELSP